MISFRSEPCIRARGMVLAVILALTVCFTVPCPAIAGLDPADDTLLPELTAKPPEPIENGFVPGLKQSYQLARAWFVTALDPSGLFVYHYNPASGRTSRNNDALRQLMSTRLLAELASEDPALVPLHEKNMAAAFSRWYKEDQKGRGFILDYGYSELGANAMALMATVKSPLFSRYQGNAKALVESILSLQNQDGSFEPFFILPRDTFDRDYCMAFYAGEATLALLEYYEKTGDEKALAAARKAQDHYLDKYVSHLAENYYPAYVPWQTFALSHLYAVNHEARYRDAIFVLNDKLLEIQDKSRYQGRFFNPDFSRYGGTHSSSDGVFTESLAYALAAAKETGDKEREEHYRNAIKLAVQNLENLQYTVEPVRVTSGRIPVTGAIRVREDDGRVRLDSTQHGMDAMRKVLSVW
ncbi:MAG: hypothetical protein AB1921_15935 [Thermodesulfobacteriota bacterium]